MKTRSQTITALLLGGFFVLSALLKLHAIERFELYLFGFGAFSFELCSWAARLLVAGELVLGIGLLSGYRQQLFCRIGFAVTLLFSLWLLYIASIGRTDNCQCFGTAIELSPLQSLCKNLLLLAGFLWAERQDRRREVQWYIPFAITALLIVGVFRFSPSLTCLRDRTQIGVSTACAEYVGERLPQGRRLVMFYGTDCSFCSMTAEMIAVICRRHNIPSEQLHAFFMQTHKQMDAPVSEFFSKAGAVHHPWSAIDLLTFIKITNGTFPVILHLNNGRIEQVYYYNTLDEKHIGHFLNPKKT